MKAAIYCRVSTEEQTDQNQEPILRKWAADRGWEVVTSYHDVGSAFQNADQKQLREMLKDANRGRFQLVLVYDLSRLTRKGPLDLMLLLKQLAESGAPVNSYLDTAINVPSDFQPVLIALFGVMANLFSKQLSARTKAGMNRARLQGKNIGRPKKVKNGIITA